MAESTRKKRGARQAVVIDLPENAGGGTAETPDESQTKTAADEQIANAIESEAQGADAMIYRADPSTGKEAFLDRVSAELVSQEWIGKEYGGGKYRVQFRKPGPNGGAFVYGGQKRFEVDDNVPRKAPRWARAAASGEVRNADGSRASGKSVDDVVSAGILAMIQQMQDNSRAQADFFRASMAQPKGPDVVALITAITPLINTMVGLMRPAVREEKDPIELAEKLLKLRGDAAPAAGEAPKGSIAQMRELLELRELLVGLGGSGEGPDPMLKVVEMLGPKIIDAFNQAQTIDAQNRLATAKVSGPQTLADGTTGYVATVENNPPRTPAQQAAIGEGAEAVWQLYVNGRIPKIIKLAQQKKNPVLYAQLEEDIMPELLKVAARELAAREDFIELILATYPQLNEWHDWMEEFFDTFAAALLGELDEDEGEGEPLEDVTDAAQAEVPVSNNGATD